MKVLGFIVVLVVVLAVIEATRYKDKNNRPHYRPNNKKHHKKKHHVKSGGQSQVQAVTPKSLLKNEWLKMTKYDVTGTSQLCQDLACPPHTVCLLDTESSNAMCIKKKALRKGLKKEKLEKILNKRKFLKKKMKNHLKRMQLFKKVVGITAKTSKNLQVGNGLKSLNDYQKHLRQYVNDYRQQADSHAKVPNTKLQFLQKKGQKLLTKAEKLEKKSQKKAKKLENHIAKHTSKDCSLKEFDIMAERLVDWFHVQMEDAKKASGKAVQKVVKGAHNLKHKSNKNQHKVKKGRKNRNHHKKHNKGKKHHRKHKKHHGKKQHHVEKRVRRSTDTNICRCLPTVAWMFAQLDNNLDRSINTTELALIDTNNYEKCLDPLLQSCDSNHDKKHSYNEWCCCFATVEAPCLKKQRKTPMMLVGGEPRPLIGAYFPQCDDDGYFNKTQCHGSTGFCWCVDSHGHEIVNTRNRGNVKCD